MIEISGKTVAITKGACIGGKRAASASRGPERSRYP